MAAEKVENLRLGLESLKIFPIKERTSCQVQDMSIAAHTSGIYIRQYHLYIETSIEMLETVIIRGCIVQDHRSNSILYFPLSDDLRKRYGEVISAMIPKLASKCK